VRLYTHKNAKEIAMSNSEPILSEFLTKEELAAELRRNPRTLDRWAVLGIGPPRTRVGRHVLYRRASVQRWLLALERSSETGLSTR
jgi:DNA-binding transcriptional MerR regulator